MNSKQSSSILKNLVIAYIPCVLLSCEAFTCEGYLAKSIKPLRFNGLINRKYIDKFNRYTPVLVVSSDIDNDFTELPLYSIHKYLYDACSEGDSLIKEVGSTTFTIVKPSGERKKVIMDCRNTPYGSPSSPPDSVILRRILREEKMEK